MYGRVDRGGAREGKKSLRKNKIAIQTLVKGKAESKGDEGPTASPPAPPIPRSDHAAAMIDFGAHLINRQFDRDQTKVLQRSRDAGIEAILSLCTDFEKLKTCLQNAAMSEHPAVLCSIGLHPNNVSSHRISEKQILTWMDEIAALAKNPRSVAVNCGLDFSRDYSTWHAQEKALSLQIDLATTLQLPVLFHDIKATERLCEIIAEKRLEGHLGLGYAVFDFTGSLEALEHYLDLDAHIVLCGQLADPAESAAHARAVVARVPADRLLLASNAPFCTPQNIEDYYIRDARNEPSNLPYTLNAASVARGCTPAELAKTVLTNAKRLLRLRYPDEAPLGPEPGEGEGEGVAGAGAAGDGDDASSAEENEAEAASGSASACAAGGEEGPSAAAAAAAAAVTKSPVQFACKSCRHTLFDLRSVQPHTDAGLRPRREEGDGDGMCGALFVMKQPWMKLEGAEGKLVCPQCNAKIGRWSLAGIQCSCGGFCSPGFKITKSYVDAIVSFATPEEAEAALASLHLDSSSDDDEGDAGPQRQRKTKKKVKKQQIGNFTQFRNKSFNFARHAKKGGAAASAEDQQEDDAD